MLFRGITGPMCSCAQKEAHPFLVVTKGYKPCMMTLLHGRLRRGSDLAVDCILYLVSYYIIIILSESHIIK